MAKLSKFKYIIICLVILAVIVSATAFSVSYASWVGGSTTLTAGGATGKWKMFNVDNIQWPTDYTGTKNAAVYSSSNGSGEKISTYDAIGNNYTVKSTATNELRTWGPGDDTGWVYYMYFCPTATTTYATFVMSKGIGGDTGDQSGSERSVQILSHEKANTNHTTHDKNQANTKTCAEGCLEIDSSCGNSVKFFDENTLVFTETTAIGTKTIKDNNNQDIVVVDLGETDKVYELCYYIPKNSNNQLGYVLYTLKKVTVWDMKPSDQILATSLYSQSTTGTGNNKVTQYTELNKNNIINSNLSRILVL